ncbi:MAG TPA: hypothetical protein VID75_05700 [Acidimicrobiales bacterium]
MIRLTGRQFRTPAAIAAAALEVVAVVVAATGPHLRQLYDAIAASCRAHGDCATAYNGYLNTDGTLRTWLGILVIVVPGLMGIFWGAPLVAREWESGTYRLAWTQSVTRDRWMAVKVGGIGLAAMIVAGLLSLMVTMWASPLDRATMNIFGTFDQRDLVPIGYGAFAFVLGVLAGVVIRRTLPAMAATVVGFVGARLAFTELLRPHLIAPVQRSLALTTDIAGLGFGSADGGPFTLLPGPPNIPNAWVVSTGILDKGGHAVTAQYVARACPRLVAQANAGGPGPGGPGGSAHAAPAPAGFDSLFHNCLEKVGTTYHEVVTFQPAARYWTFQWYELAVYLGAALVLAAVSLWWVRRRLS